MYTALARQCTRSVHAENGRVHGTYIAVHTGRKDGRVHATRPCTGCVHGRVRAAYTAVIGSGTDHVRGPCAAVYTVCTRPWAAVYTGRKQGRVQSTRPCRCTLYMAVDVPCTRPLHASVHDPYTPKTAVYTVRTMPCTRAVKTVVFTVHGRVRAAYTAVIGSRTDHVRGSCTAVYTVCTGRVHGP